MALAGVSAGGRAGSGVCVGWEFRPPPPIGLLNDPPRPIPGRDYAELRREWQRRVEAEQAAAQVRAGWVPVIPRENPATFVVFGGTTLGWEALLATVGPGLISEGRTALVLNLTRRPVAHSLEQLMADRGVPTRRDAVGSAAAALSTLGAAATWPRLLDWIMRLLNAQEGKADRLEAMADRAMLEDVTHELGADVSIPRLRSGLRVVLGRDGPPVEGAPLTFDEFDRLVVLYPEDVRARTDILSRAFRLDQHLGRLAQDRAGVRYDPTDLEPSLRILEVDPGLGSADAAETAEALIELAATRWRASTDLSGEMLVLAAPAERIDARLVEELADLGGRFGGRIVMLFERLREETVDALGVDACHSFMRLSDHRDAEQACEYIGREDQFVIAQTTRQRGSSYERGENVSRSKQWGTTVTTGEQGRGLLRIGSESTATQRGGGHTVGDSMGESQNVSVSVTEELRSEQLIVRPTEIQTLPETALFLVERTQPRTVRLVDCDPGLAELETGHGG